MWKSKVVEDPNADEDSSEIFTASIVCHRMAFVYIRVSINIGRVVFVAGA